MISLALIADTGGPMFRGYVEPTLGACLRLMLSSAATTNADVAQGWSSTTSLANPHAPYYLFACTRLSTKIKRFIPPIQSDAKYRFCTEGEISEILCVRFEALVILGTGGLVESI